MIIHGSLLKNYSSLIIKFPECCYPNSHIFVISKHKESQKVSLLSVDLHEHLRYGTAIFKEQFKDILTRNDVF
jgi:hypothetical protein